MHLFIEADSIASERMSGIGHATLEIVNALDKEASTSKLKVTIIIPFGRKKYVNSYNWKNVKIRQLPPAYKYVNYALTRTSLPIPINLLYGRGVYVFPNYKTWFTPFSKSIMFIDDVSFKLFPETTQHQNLKYLNTNIPRWLKRASGFVSISEQSTREVIKEYPIVKDRIKTVHLGVNPDEYYPRHVSEIEQARVQYDIKNDYFVFVGNLEPRKNVLAIVEAYKLYADSVKLPAQLVLIGGDGWKNKEVIHRIKQLKNQGYDILRPKKYVLDKDLPAIFSGARALVHLAIHEGFGLPPIEAQATGTPVIVSNLPVFIETLNPELTSFVNYNDVESIAKKMKATTGYSDDRKSNALPDLNWRNTAKELIKFAGIISSDGEYGK